MAPYGGQPKDDRSTPKLKVNVSIPSAATMWNHHKVKIYTHFILNSSVDLPSLLPSSYSVDPYHMPPHLSYRSESTIKCFSYKN